MKLSIRYNFLIDLDSTDDMLSSDYSLNVCFSPRFPYIDGQRFSQCKPLQNVHFWKADNMQFFREFYSPIDKNSGEKV